MHWQTLTLQKSCIDFTIGARPLERYMPSKRNSFKYKVWRIVVSTPFEYFIMMLIVFNTLLLMMKVCSSGTLTESIFLIAIFFARRIVFSFYFFLFFLNQFTILRGFFLVSRNLISKNFMHKFDLIYLRKKIENFSRKDRKIWTIYT